MFRKIFLVGFTVLMMTDAAFGIGSVTVNIDGINFVCGAGGAVEAGFKVESVVDVSCLQQKYNQMGASWSMAVSWTDHCRDLVDQGNCRLIAQSPNDKCFAEISNHHGLSANMSAELSEKCRTKTYICK